MKIEKDDPRAQEARKVLAQEHGLEEDELEWVGPMQVPFAGPEAALICYNIMRVGHSKFKSTVAFKSGWTAK